VKIAGDNLEEYTGKSDEYYAQPPGKRFWVIFAGPLLNYLLGFLCFWLIFFAGYPALTTKVGGLLEGFGAQGAGIKPGDRITAIDGKAIDTWDDLQAIVHAKKAAENVLLIVERDKEEMKFTVRIKQEKVEDQVGTKQNIGLLGITPDFQELKVTRHGFLEAFVLALKRVWLITEMTYRGLWRMCTGNLSVRQSITGPIGMFMITFKIARQGVIALLNFVALISVSLALFNLLPLPILDGGHIFLLGLEKIRGRTLSMKTERIVTQAGLTLIVGLALFVTYNDILKHFGDKISRIFK
jgi:regulator of sigma E protease